MKLNKKSLLLYAVTDKSWASPENSLLTQVEQAILGGATFIQYREKTLSKETCLAEAKQMKKITDQYNVPFVVNDYVDIALLCDADGVHVGQEDLEAEAVRSKIGPNKILGVSALNVTQALLAEKAGADYIGVGTMFPTDTKQDAKKVTFDELRAICEAVSIPVVAIGGIDESNVLKLQNFGIDGIAVVSAIFSKSNIQKAANEMLTLSRKVVQS